MSYDPTDFLTPDQLASYELLPADFWSSNGDAPTAEAEPFTGLTHAEALAANVEELAGGQLVEDLVELGTLGTIAGIPETGKSFLAQAIGTAVAHGRGYVLGRPVLKQATVGYWWQDDSRRNELERIQTLAHIRDTPENLPLRWFLNEGLLLPDHLDRLRATIELHGFGLAIVDSFYNVAGLAAGKDREAGAIFALLKTEVCDPTGCSVLVVDHAPWPSESNQGQMRGYGDVHKAAAIRWGIYLARERGKLFVSARSNNSRGIKRTPAYWDEDTLELRLVDVDRVNQDALDEEVLAYTLEHPGASTSAIAAGLGKSKNTVGPALKRLSSCENAQTPQKLVCKTSRALGTPGTGHYWFPLNHAPSEASQLFETPQDASASQAYQDGEASQPSHPRRGDASPDASLTDDDFDEWGEAAE
jgi:hypothetical protein